MPNPIQENTMPDTSVSSDQQTEKPVDVDPFVLEETPYPGPPAPVELIAHPSEEKPVEKETEKVEVAPQYVRQDFPINHSHKVTNTEQLDLPGASPEVIQNVFKNLPNLELVNNEEDAKWLEVLQNSNRFSPMFDAFKKSLQQSDSEWAQFIEYKNSKLAGVHPRHASNKPQTLSGEKALLKLESHLGTGDLYQVPLWHSGFWVTFKPPSDAEIIELQRLLLNEKYQFGRRSYGMVYSNMTAMFVERVLNLAISHVYQYSFVLPETEDIRDHISIHDLYVLLWGFICTAYPRGFEYRVACTANPETCTHVSTDTLNLTKLQWTNGKALTEWQKHHMSYRSSNSRKLEDVKRYRDELTSSANETVCINKGEPGEIELVLKTPSCLEYIRACHRWLDNITVMVEKMMEPTAEEIEEISAYGVEQVESWRKDRQQKKEQLLVSHAQAGAIRHFSHMFSKIRFDEIVVEDQETVENALARISTDGNVRDKVFEAVSTYRDKSCISLIGIPNFKCPNCKQPQKTNENLPAFTSIIPLDVLTVFFSLVNRRAARIKQR